MKAHHQGFPSNTETARVVYGVAVLGVVALTAAVTALLAAIGGATLVWQALAALFALPLGGYYAGRIARPVVTRLIGPHGARLLPRAAPGDTIPDAWRTLVVLPAIVATPARARELLFRVAQLARQHDDPNLRFALLADFPDSPTGATAADAEILAEEQRLVAWINADLRDQLGDRVFVLHRARRRLDADRTWMGWERKRGKLLELHRLLRGRTDTSYQWIFGAFAHQMALGGFPYVFTLDEANWLPRGEILSILRVAAHPANRAQLDADSGRLVRGYAIFQPNVVPVDPAALADPNGLASAARHVAAERFHFDVLGVGIFQGKGLFDVVACHALLGDVFPDGEVLQHDPMEGFVARTAEVHDALVFEAQAPGYLAQVQRGHRWLRGTFQMLRWVMPRVRGADGAPRANPFRFAHRLFVVELALTELARPASLVLLLAGWLALDTHAGLWTVVVCPPLAMLLAQGALRASSAVGAAIHRRIRLGAASPEAPPLLRRLAVDAFATLFALAMLPYEALVVADALCRTVWRLFVSRRLLLDWPAIDRVHAASRPRTRREYHRVLWICHAAGLLALASVGASRPDRLPLVLPFAALWICAPSIAAWLDGALVDPDPERPITGPDARTTDPHAELRPA